nr:hypothetical protein [Tanacetum cinerariifolium]
MTGGVLGKCTWGVGGIVLEGLSEVKVYGSAWGRL